MLPDLIRSGRSHKKKPDILQSISFLPIPGVGFSPNNLPNLIHWFQPEGLRGGVIVPIDFEWDDAANLPFMETGSLADVTPPPPVVNGIGTLNGHNYLSLQGGFPTQNGGYTDTSAGAPSITVVGICSYEASAVLTRYLWDIKGAVPAQFNMFVTDSNGFINLRAISADATQNTVAHAVDKTGTGFFIYIGTINNSNKTVTLYIDGTTTTNQDLTQDNYEIGLTLCCINICTALPASQWVGNMGEWLFYSDVKSVADINLLGNYFAAKYSLTWTGI